MVLYNEHNPDDEAIGSVVKADMRTRPDALIVVGTTLKVPGVKRIVKEMCGIVRARKDGVTVWINNDPPPALKDYEWDLVVQGPCDQVAVHAAMRRWDEPQPQLEPVSDEQLAQVKREQMAEVVITSPMKNRTVDRINGLSTPSASPKMKPATPVLAMTTSVVTGAAKKQTTLAGTKRKGNSKPSAASKKPQAAKKPAPKKKELKKNQKPQASGLKLQFKVAKHSQPIPIKPVGKESALEIAAVLSRPRVEPIDLRDPALQPVSPGDFRNNPSPPLVPRKSYGDLKVNTSSPGWETREERQRVVSPTSKPKGMDNLIS
jgi:NAD-dependent histone deacetylase SIR2